MFYVTDTHTLFWFITGDSKLSKNASAVFSEAENGNVFIIVPTMVLAELLFIFEKNKEPENFSALIEKLAQSPNFAIHDLNLGLISQLQKLTAIPELHDRIIAATALINRATVLTKDDKIIKSGYVETIW